MVGTSGAGGLIGKGTKKQQKAAAGTLGGGSGARGIGMSAFGGNWGTNAYSKDFGMGMVDKGKGGALGAFDSQNFGGIDG